MATEREQAIIKVAEAMIREGGYNNFSFRNIANEVGIKSSSVHYHFATKEELAAAVVRQYTERFIAFLDAASSNTNADPLATLVAGFKSALVNDKSMCLCGMLGSEAEILPETVQRETRRFFDECRSWLENVYEGRGESNSDQKAWHTLGVLEGAMMMANVMDDPTLFDQITQPIVAG